MVDFIRNLSELESTFKKDDSLDKSFLKKLLSYMKVDATQYQLTRKNAEFAYDYSIPTYKDFKEVDRTPSFKKESYFCHNPWTLNYSKYTTFLCLKITNIVKEGATESKQLFDYLLGEDSPWASILSHVTVLLGTNDHPTHILFRKLNDIDLHTMTNFVIATRAHTQFYYGPQFCQLLSVGFTPEEAFYLLYYFRPAQSIDAYSSGSKLILYQAKWGDIPFSQCTPFKQFSKKTPKSTKPWPQRSPNPCNYIWGDIAPEDEYRSWVMVSPSSIYPRLSKGGSFILIDADLTKYFPKKSVTSIKKLLNAQTPFYLDKEMKLV